MDATNPRALLDELEHILIKETDALRRLDYAAIDEATRAKEALEPALRRVRGGEVDADQRNRITTHARENQARLLATLHSVRGLLEALTGGPQPSYGPRKQGGAPAAVLTSVVG